MKTPKTFKALARRVQHANTPKCGAKTRSGHPCPKPALLPHTRCRYHGGLQQGPALMAHCLPRYAALPHQPTVITLCADADGVHQIPTLPHGTERCPVAELDDHVRNDDRLDEPGFAIYTAADLTLPHHLQAVLALDAAFRIRWLPEFTDRVTDVARAAYKRKHIPPRVPQWRNKTTTKN